jgi:clan AA aspartic protease (TIGR02281 family)
MSFKFLAAGFALFTIITPASADERGYYDDNGSFHAYSKTRPPPPQAPAPPPPNSTTAAGEQRPNDQKDFMVRSWSKSFGDILYRPLAVQQERARTPDLFYAPWTKFCLAKESQVCFTGMDGRIETGQQVIGAVIIEPEGKPKKVLRITLPLGVQLVYGTRIVIDKSPPQQSFYAICLANGCMSDYEVTPDLLNNLKQGQQLMVQAINGNGAPLTFSLPLQETGGSFAKAYDSPPIDPRAFEETQKRKREEVQKWAARKKFEGQHYGERAPERSNVENEVRVKMRANQGLYSVPVLINDAQNLDFVVDSGATAVCIPEQIVGVLISKGTIKERDFIGIGDYMLANGSLGSSRIFMIRSLKVGNRAVTDVRAMVTDGNGMLLLGQSFLSRFKTWSQDNVSHELVLQ